MRVSQALVVLAILLAPRLAMAEDRFIIVQSTTSTQNSGLYEAILPVFEQATGIKVRVVAVGTGQAIKNAANCDGDVLLVHAKAAEEKFVENGFGLSRADVMYNDFVIVGPEGDPAEIRNAKTITQALEAIAGRKAIFASRGDDSGTHKKELALWRDAGLDPIQASGGWYRETGSGMGATLNIAVGMGGYALTDRATWLTFENAQSHQILFDGDAALFNQYGVIQVNPAHCPNVKSEDGDAFISWLLKEGQREIENYTRGGEQLFFANAK